MNDWWGINENITPLEIAARSAVMFLLALIMIRLSGMRSFGKGESFDKIITFLIGAILSRGVVGASPFFSTIVSVIVILIIHNLLSRMSVFSGKIGKLVKGERILLYKNGSFQKDNMKRTNISEQDIFEELRMQCKTNEIDKMMEVYMERTGELSFIKKEE
jgi:uncharacterized membrane protein YcaP (DUF421 family)